MSASAPTPQPSNTLPPAMEEAQTQGRLTVSRVSLLFSPEGAPIANHPQPVLALAPDAPPGALRKVYPPDPRFEGAEHTYLGDNISLQFDTGTVVAGQYKITLQNGLQLTYGQIVALSGDFYALPGEAISEDPSPPQRFLQAYATLASSPSSVSETQQILAVMQTEITDVNNAIRQGLQPSSAYAQLGETLSGKWNRITGGGCYFTDFLPPGRYLDLASTNWDHFGNFAIAAYKFGHQAAANQALTARNIQDPANKLAALNLAYAMNAFADHYLTDLFSSGHMRTPRKVLYDCVTPSFVGSMLAKYMHDEDSAYGLNVSNSEGTSWTAYGDKRLRDAVDSQNMQICEQAVGVSAQEIWAAYQTGASPANAALNKVANLQALTSNPQNSANICPLFVAAGIQATALRRTDMNNLHSYSWTQNWLGWSTLCELQSLPEFAGYREVPTSMQAGILQFYADQMGGAGMAQYGPMGANYGLLWHLDNMFPSGASSQFVQGDFNGDGTVEIVELCNSESGMALYTQTPGSGWARAWSSPGMPSGYTAISWLVVDMAGDGHNQIAQVWDNGGSTAITTWGLSNGAISSLKSVTMPKSSAAVGWLVVDKTGNGQSWIAQMWNNGDSELGMILYAPDGNGGYTLSWSWDNNGSPGSAIQFLAADANGDGKTEIVQLWDNGGVLAMFVFGDNGSGGYTQIWHTLGQGQKSTALKWLVGDINGDGRDEIVQLLDSNGQLAMNLYMPDQNGAYTNVVTTPSLGRPSTAIDWLSSQADDNLNMEIIQLVDMAGQLGMTVYSPNGAGYGVAGDVQLGFSSSAIDFMLTAVNLS